MSKQYIEGFGTLHHLFSLYRQSVKFLVMAVLVSNIFSSQVYSQADPIETAKNLIVMITGDLQGATVTGAGVAFNVSRNRIYIVTADHVVRLGSELENIKVEFWQLPGEIFEATLLAPLDTSLDMAVLSVPMEEALLTEDDFPFELLSGADVSSTENVFTVGYGGERPWNTPVEKANVLETKGGIIALQSSTVSKGDSGGGVFTEDGKFVGLTITDAFPALEAIEASTLFEVLKSNRYSISEAEVSNEVAPETPDTTQTPTVPTNSEPIEIEPNFVQASSQNGNVAVASMAMDGNLESKWQDVSSRPSEAWFEIVLDEFTTITRIGFYNRDASFSRIKQAILTFADGSKQSITVRGLIGWEYVELTPIKTDSIRINSFEVVKGERSSNLAVHELTIFGYE
jgi:hypothetical protein